MVAHAFSPGTWEAEEEFKDSRSLGHTEFLISWDYRERPVKTWGGRKIAHGLLLHQIPET